MRIQNGVSIVLFMAMSMIPLVFADMLPERVSVRENRMLAASPVLADLKKGPETFIRKFDAWFKDSTGFREQLLTLYHAVEESRLLNTIWNVEGGHVFLVGEQGYRYFADQGGILIPKFQGKQFLSDEQLQNTAAKLEEVRKYLDGRGIPLAVMICPDKESVYPEFYPKLIKRGPEPDQLDVITGYLREHTGADVFSIRRALVAEKDAYPPWDKAGGLGALTHYNQIGAFFGYRELMRHINIHFPGMVPYELEDLEISYDELGENPVVSFKEEKRYKKLDSSFFEDFSVVDDWWGHNWNEAYENTDPGLPVILLFRTSFSGEEYTGKFIAQHFGKAILTQFVNMGHIEEYVTKYKPDIVVFETAERALDMFADSFAGIPDLNN